MTDFPLDLSSLFLRQRRCLPDRLAGARGGLCDFVPGEALGVLPLGFESAGRFAFLGGGHVGVGAGWHYAGEGWSSVWDVVSIVVLMHGARSVESL